MVDSTTYNNRLQAQTIGLGTLLTVTNGYGPAGTNNGNVMSQDIFDGTTTRTQSFTYDAGDRLTVAAEGSTWRQQYAYDVFGNRALLVGSDDPGTGLDTLLTIKTTNPNSLPFSGSTNRWAPVAPSRVRFDAHADAPACFTIRYLALQF